MPRPTSRTAKEVKADYEGIEWLRQKLSEDGSSAELRYAPTLNFRNMKITGDLSKFDLSYADFYGADLTGCNLQRANLTRCDPGPCQHDGC